MWWAAEHCNCRRDVWGPHADVSTVQGDGRWGTDFTDLSLKSLLSQLCSCDRNLTSLDVQRTALICHFIFCDGVVQHAACSWEHQQTDPKIIPMEHRMTFVPFEREKEWIEMLAKAIVVPSDKRHSIEKQRSCSQPESPDIFHSLLNKICNVGEVVMEENWCCRLSFHRCHSFGCARQLPRGGVGCARQNRFVIRFEQTGCFAALSQTNRWNEMGMKKKQVLSSSASTGVTQQN